MPVFEIYRNGTIYYELFCPDLFLNLCMCYFLCKSFIHWHCCAVVYSMQGWNSGTCLPIAATFSQCHSDWTSSYSDCLVQVITVRTPLWLCVYITIHLFHFTVERYPSISYEYLLLFISMIKRGLKGNAYLIREPIFLPIIIYIT